MNTKNKPVHDIRLGAIKAAIWANQTPKGTRYSVTFTRLYKDGDQWKRSESFGRDDLPLIEKVANQAYLWICATAQAAQAAEPGAIDDGPVEVNV